MRIGDVEGSELEPECDAAGKLLAEDDEVVELVLLSLEVVGHRGCVLDPDLLRATMNNHNATITRGDIAIETPDGKIIPMATQEAFSKGFEDLRPMDARANVQRQSLNYLPREANQACRIGFFASTSQGPARSLAFDQFSLTPRNACLGRLYFQIPDGIQYGEYALFVKFPSEVEVPFTIMTKEQAKEWEKKWKEERKEAKEKKK
jgi:hypothetical protein